MNRMPMPVAPQVMGYSGANPVRAMQAMTGGVNRIAASPYAPQQPVPGGAVFTGAPPVRPMASEFNPLTNAPQFSQPTLIEAVNSAGMSRPSINPNMPPLVSSPMLGAGADLSSVPRQGAQAITPRMPTLVDSVNSAGMSRPNINPATPPLVTPMTGAGSTISQAPQQGAQAITPQIGNSVSTINRAVQTAGANHSLGSTVGGVGSSLSGGTLSGAKSPVSNVAPVATAAGKLDGASAFGGSSTQRTAPSGFLAYNAADPTRALKMMRGY